MDRETLIAKAPVVDAPLKRHLFVCTGKSCSSFDSEAVLEKFWEILKDKGLLYGKRGSWEGSVLVTTCGSIGLCQVGPTVLVYPDGVWYYNVKVDDVEEIAEQHLVQGKPVERLLARYIPGGSMDPEACLSS